jgi:hypothetical protein
MMNQNNDQPTTETVRLNQPLDPGAPAEPGDDMLADLPTAAEVGQTGPVRNPNAPPRSDEMTAGLPRTINPQGNGPTVVPAYDIAPNAPEVVIGFGPPVAPELADIDPPLVAPVTNVGGKSDMLRSDALGPMSMQKQSEKERMALFLNDLVDDLKRLAHGPVNPVKRIMGRQTLGADLLRLYQDHEYTIDHCMTMVEIESVGHHTTQISLTLPASKMTSRIQMKLIALGYKTTKTENGLVLRSPVEAAGADS